MQPRSSGKCGAPASFLLLGGLGNVATIFVLHRTKGHNSSHHVFLIALAVADLSCLGTYVLGRLFSHCFSLQIWTLNTVTCKLYFWIRSASYRLSSWLVTAVTVQRTLAITCPHRVRVMCTVRRTWTVVAALVFVALALRSHLLVMYRIPKNDCKFHKTASYVFFIRYMNTCFILVFLPSLRLPPGV
eukprot:TRINITY_DN14255_c0_g1_i15.p1 TRINITY_DN14255_c0_g1~~TRINITY_DN14255_c0_g1_i15.p1  ORF type:complete len:187 (-),score=15.85 TRINITY_DN14255_c0_g1_i15:357-917(-)